MKKSPMFSTESIMANRGGLPIKNIICAVFIIASLYLVYIYNGSLNQLRESEMTSARYRREADDRVSEIQELIKAKDDLQERCENDKRELVNRAKSINQGYSMLQSQHKETEADFMKLKQDMETLRSEHMQAENQHAQEYQDLKSEKERIIVGLEEEVRLSKKSAEELRNTVASLQSQMKNGENLQQSLREQNAKLHLQQYQQQQNLQQQILQQQQQHQQQPQQPQQGGLNPNQVFQDGQPSVGYGQNVGLPIQQGAQLTGGQQQGANLVQNMKIPGAVDLSNNGLDVGNAQPQPNDAGLSNHRDLNGVAQDQNKDQLGSNKDVNIEALNAKHQVLPPGNNDNFVDEQNNVDDKEDLSQGEKRPDVNPNDLQKGQILEPMLDTGGDNNNKADGGEDNVAQDSIRQAENDREKEEMDNTFMEHKNPLALGQMQQPDNLQHFEGEGEGLGQQKAPVMSNEDDKNQDGKNDQQLYYQDDEVDKFLKQKDQDFDADDDNNGQKGVVMSRPNMEEDNFNDGPNQAQAIHPIEP